MRIKRYEICELAYNGQLQPLKGMTYYGLEAALKTTAHLMTIHKGTKYVVNDNLTGKMHQIIEY